MNISKIMRQARGEEIEPLWMSMVGALAVFSLPIIIVLFAVSLTPAQSEGVRHNHVTEQRQ